MDNIDIIIEDIVKKDIYIPKEFEDVIYNAIVYKEKNKIKSILVKIIWIITSLITLTTGVVFAKDISKWINNIFNPQTTNKSIIKMAESGYIQETNMEYIMNGDVGVKIDDILMDDYNLIVVFEFKTKEKIEDCYFSEIEDLLITDENNNIVFCNYDRFDLYEKFCKEHNIEYSKNNMDNNYTNGGYQQEIIQKTNNSIKILYKMYSTGYPKSKKLIFSFKELDIALNVESTINNNYQKIIGNWNLEIELPSVFYNREIFLYGVEDNSDKVNDIIFEEAIGSYTEMHIKLTIKNMIDPYEPTKEGIDKVIENTFKLGETYTVTLENEKGKIIKKGVVNRDSTGGISYHPNGNATCSMVFQMSKEDYTKKLKLYIKVKDREFVINLSRK